MQFTTPIFLFYFLPAALALHRYTLFKSKTGSPNLTRISIFFLTLVFYGWNSPWWLIPFLFSVGTDFLWASLLCSTSDEKRRKLYCTLAVTQNISLLAFFKYNPLGIAVEMPAGISFYTFESVSYVIDIYRRTVVPPKNAWNFLAFIGMFPRFIAGPIVRYKELEAQLEARPVMQLEPGLFLFSIGLFSKCCLGDSFSHFVGYAFEPRATMSLLAAWLGVFAYTMQIYFDFAGYSLMAIGLGRCLGFQFPSNFNKPYRSESLQDFWRRWHITLSRWLRDYVYIPLGGNQRGEMRNYLNLWLTMVIGAMWHGAGLPFLLWGAWHGTLLVVERQFSRYRSLSLAVNELITFLAVMIGWVFFRSSSLTQVKDIFMAMFIPSGDPFALNTTAFEISPTASFFAAVGLVYLMFIESRISFKKLENIQKISFKHAVLGIVFLVTALLTGLSSWVVPFLYFNF